MVKRQTVWLSTMMVLSLMLIGYYTMNNETSTTTTAANNASDVTASVSPVPGTSTGNNTSNQGAGSGGTTSSSAANSTSSQSSGAASASDWFVNMETTQTQQMSQQIENQRTVLANNNATSEQLSQAEQKLQELTAVQGELATAREIVLGKGYQDCVIVPSSDGMKFTVNLMSKNKVTAAQAVAIMNAVSQELNVSAANVVVQQK